MRVLPLILLNATNHWAIRGPITEESASAFFDAALSAPRGAAYVYLDTPGGSVEAGLRIAHFLQQRNLTCIAQRAHSMGFALLQHCGARWITPHGVAMQHQMSLQLPAGGDLGKLQEQLAAAARTARDLEQRQARRIGVSAAWFRNRTLNEWWVAGRDAIRYGCADAVVHVECTPALTRSTVVLATAALERQTFSACPLVTAPRPEL